jgi:SAM-dependent methyltransferase
MYLHWNVDGLSGEVAEFLPVDNATFKFVRIREDKRIGVLQGTNYGNNFRVAESTLLQLMNPLTVEEMTSTVSTKGYFVESADKDYKPLTKLNNYVKAQILSQLENTEWVADLASGKGQDIFTYNCYGVRNLVCCDIDAQALEELNNRRYLMNGDVCVFGKKPESPVHVYIAKLDLTNKADTNRDHLLRLSDGNKYAAVVINLAIHYLLNDTASIKNLINLIDNILSPGGTFIFTCFDGHRIYKLLEKFNVTNGHVWDSTDKKFSIRRDYPKDAKFSGGLKIGVKHHFGGGEYYTESLVDIQSLIDMFGSSGYSAIQYGSFADLHDSYSQFNKVASSHLTTCDLLYSSLYSYVSLRKVNEKK